MKYFPDFMVFKKTEHVKQLSVTALDHSRANILSGIIYATFTLPNCYYDELMLRIIMSLNLKFDRISKVENWQKTVLQLPTAHCYLPTKACDIIKLTRQ
jgi:hypothetical protein